MPLCCKPLGLWYRTKGKVVGYTASVTFLMICVWCVDCLCVSVSLSFCMYVSGYLFIYFLRKDLLLTEPCEKESFVAFRIAKLQKL